MKKIYSLFFFLVLTFFTASLHAATWYVRINANGDGKTPNNAFGNVNSAIAASSAGDVIDIGKGEFTASNLIVDKHITIRGTDSDDTIFNGSGTFITFTAGGTSLANPTIIENIGLEGYKFAFAEVRSFTSFNKLAINGSNTDPNVWTGNVVTFANGASNVEFEFCTFYNYWGDQAADAYFEYSTNGAAIIKIPDNYSVSNITFNRVNFETAGYGFYASQSDAPSGSTSVNNIVFNSCYFSDIKYKGILAEKITGLTVLNCVFEDVGQTTGGEPGAIDVSFKWQSYTGDVNIKNSSFIDCASPSSGTDVNGSAVRVRALTAGLYGSSPASWTGNTYIDKCYFKNNNAGVIIGGAYDGSGTGLNNTLSGVANITNSVFEENTLGTQGAYNHFDIRHIATNTMNVSNCFFLRGGIIKNPTVQTTFATGQVSDVNPDGGSVNITNTNLVGQFYAETSLNVYTGFANFNNALNAVPSGNHIYVLKSGNNLIPTINTSKSFILQSADGYLDLTNNFTLNNNAQATLNSSAKFSGQVSLNTGKIIVSDFIDMGFNSFGNSNGTIECLGTKSILRFSSATGHNIPLLIGTPMTLELNNGEFSTNTDITARDLIFYDGTLQMNNQILTVENAMGNGNIEAKFGAVKFKGTKYLSKMEAGVDSKDFILDNFIGLQLTSDLNIYETLSLKNGNLFMVSETNDENSSGELGFGPNLVYDNSGPTGGMIVVNSELDGEIGKAFRADKLNFTFPIATYKNGTRLSLPITINLNSNTVFEDDYNGNGIEFAGYIYLELKKGLNSKAPVGTNKYANFSYLIESYDFSNLNYTATFGYDENLFIGGLIEPELALYRFNGTTNPNLKRYPTTKNTTANTYSITDTKFGEFMFLADDGTTPTATPDFPVVNTRTDKGFGTIQAAIDDSETEDYNTIKIAAGVYPEFITLNKSVYLEGNNAGTKAWDWTKPITEIRPPSTDFTKPLITIDTNNISIDGIAFNGTNNLINDATPRNINGFQIRINTAIGSITANNNYGFTIQNNRFNNFARGLSLFATTEQNISSISQNVFENIININSSAGIAIITSNYSSQITNNRFNKVDRGIQLQYSNNGYGYSNIFNNNISAYRFGIYAVGNLLFNFPSLDISSNNIDSADYNLWTADGFTRPTTNQLDGILIANTKGNGDITILNNNVSNALDGIYLEANVKSNSNPDRIKILNGVYTNNRIGIYDYNTGVNFNTRTIISGAKVTNSNFIGILNENDTATGNIISEMVLKDGVIIDHPLAQLGGYIDGIQIYGAKAVLSELNDAKIGSSRQYFIRISNNAMTGKTVSAKDVTFDGTVNGVSLNNYKPSATFNLALRSDAKSRIFDGDVAGNNLAGIVTIPSTLPVSLIDFTANLKTQGVVLAWSTASELNNKTFILEKSIDGKTFTELAKINGAGSFSGLSKYEFVDKDFIQSCYYRLTQEDLNGNKKVYDEMIKYVKSINQLTFNAYPNPTTDKIFLNTNQLPKETKVNLIDLKGNTLATKLSDELTTEFDTSNLPVGIYIIQIETSLPIQPIKFTKK